MYQNEIQYNTIQYNTMQCNTIQYNTIQYNTIKGLTSTFRSSCYSARLSWALVLTWVSPFTKTTKMLGFGFGGE